MLANRFYGLEFVWKLPYMSSRFKDPDLSISTIKSIENFLRMLEALLNPKVVLLRGNTTKSLNETRRRKEYVSQILLLSEKCNELPEGKEGTRKVANKLRIGRVVRK